MFDDLLESTSEKKKDNKGWGFVLSGVVQALILGILILIPLIYTEALPKAMLSTLLIAPPPPPPPPPPPAPVKTIVKPVARLIQSGKLTQPRAIPKEVAVFKEAELPPDVINNAGNTGGVFGGIPGQGMVSAVAPPPPKPTAPQRVKQGGNVTAASILQQTKPLYPALARQARIQGNVVLHAIIDKDGKVAQLEVISGHPLLVQSALDAVKQWRYKPTLLNGDPVEVDTTITVTFTMGG
jgi:periplasmic protein TonB